MRNFKLLAIITLFILPIITSATNVDRFDENEILIKTLNEIGAEYVEGDFNANGVIAEEFLSVEELDNIGRGLVDYYGMVDSQSEEMLDNNYRQISYYGLDNKSNPLTIIVSSYYNEESEKGETYLYINSIKNVQEDGINDIITLTEELFENYENNVEITTCLIGTIDGKLSNEYTKNTVPEILNELSFQIVDIYQDGELVSYTAYTKKMEDYILAGDDRINLNIALRYNEYDDNTLVWIGTPIITSGY